MVGLPAIRFESERGRSRLPHLRLVRPVKRGRNVKRRPAANAGLARSAFNTFFIVALLLSVVAMGRVWVTVQAAEASSDAGELREQIRSERYEGDMLEIRQSALGSPSRIREIAGETMGMAPAAGVTYLELPHENVTGEREAETDSIGGFSRVLAQMMDVAAGEAEVMLVGDVGLTSAR